MTDAPKVKKSLKKMNVNVQEFSVETPQPQIAPQVVQQPIQFNQQVPLVVNNLPIEQPQSQNEPKLQLKKKQKAEQNNVSNNNESTKIEQPQVVQPVAQQQKPVAEQPKVAEKPQVAKVASQPAKTVVNYELIAYFLDKDVQYDIEEDQRKVFESRLITFLNRKYEISQGKDSFNRSNNKNMTTKPNGAYPQKPYNKFPQNNGNSFPNGEIGSITRGDSKKMTAPILHKNNSGVTAIKRGEEDKDVTQLKMKIKQQSGLILEKMRSEKLDSFKKQISDIRLDLNILTPTNFDIIKKKLFDLAMSNEVLCEHVVEGIIEKARTQKTYSLVYANLCKYMIDESKKFTDERNKIFKNHLYTNIQQTFEGEKDIYNNKMTFAKQKVLSELTTEEEKNQYFADKKKREMLNVQFIGNLFLNKSMGYQILTICCSELLLRFIRGFCEVTDQQRDNQEVEEAHYEDHLEALIALFEQTGQKMEEKNESNKKTSTKKTDSSSILNGIISVLTERKMQENSVKDIEVLSFDDYFTLIDWLKKNKRVSPRIYSLIINLIERKNENWKDRLSTQTGPQSLQSLHKKHEEEMRQNQIELAKYEQKQKFTKQDSRNNRRDDKKKTISNTQANNGKYDEKSGIVRAKEFWGYLDTKVKIQEDYTVAHAINDFKQFKEECDQPVTYGEILIKTVYDCNKTHKEDRIQVAKEAATNITPEQFTQGFNDRLNKSKDESSDFPLFLEFLSEIFVHFFKQGAVSFNKLKISYKPEYDDDDKEDLNFVYMQFFEESINLLKQQQPFDAAAFIKEQIDPVLSGKDDRYNNWVKDNSK